MYIQLWAFRVESVAAAGSFDVDLLPLRGSVHALQIASLELDSAKNKAEHKLSKILKKLKKRHSIRRKIRRKVSKALCKLRKVFGKDNCERKNKHNDADAARPHKRVSSHSGWMIGSFSISFRQPSRHLIKAIQRVQAMNKRLIAFERGFISKDGIKDREWYKHLGVAPGKWLGQCHLIRSPVTEANNLLQAMAPQLSQGSLKHLPWTKMRRLLPMKQGD